MFPKIASIRASDVTMLDLKFDSEQTEQWVLELYKWFIGQVWQTLIDIFVVSIGPLVFSLEILVHRPQLC